MVGQPKIGKCLTCRKRKIKCDEVTPVCGQCQRDKRHCSGPTVTRVFVDQGPKLREQVGICGQEHFQDLPSQSVWLPSDKQLANGHLLQKWRRVQVSRVCVEPQLSSSELLALRFAELLGGQDKSVYAHRTSPWLLKLPCRIGHSNALDAGIDCISRAYSSVLRKDDASLWIDGKLYGKALRYLQQAIADPVESVSFNTLLSTAVMVSIESCGGNKPGRRFHSLHHAGGCASLIEARGPASFQDESELSVLWQIASAVYHRSLRTGEPCFLASVQWSPVWDRIARLYDPDGTEILCLSTVKLMMYWPSFIQDYTTLLITHCPVKGRELLLRLLDVEAAVRDLDRRFRLLLEGHTAIQIIPSSREEKFPPNVYKFKDDWIAVAYSWYACYSLIINAIILNTAAMLPASATDILLNRPAADTLALANIIWMSYEHAWTIIPLGANYIAAPLALSYSYGDLETQRWIVRSLNELEEYIQEPHPRFNETTISLVTKMFTGEKSLKVAPEGLLAAALEE